MAIDLGLVRRRLRTELGDLEHLADEVGASRSTVSLAAAEYCVLQLLDVWNRCVRDVVLISASGRAVDRQGTIISAGPMGQLRSDAAMAYLRANWPRSKKPGHWEPSWFDVQQSFTAIDLLAPSNAQDLKAALGAGNNPVEEVRALRNYCAHRGRLSAARLSPSARSWGPPTWNRPHDMVIVAGPAGLPSIFEDWCRAFKLVGDALV